MYTEEEQWTGEWVRSLTEQSEYGVRAFYKTYRWIMKRRQILARDHNACVMCRMRGRYSRAAVVHHITHLKACPELALSEHNLVSLCKRCHEEVHPERKEAREKYFQRMQKKELTPERW